MGTAVNGVSCRFPSDLDPGEEPFEGVQFIIYEQRICVSAEEFRIFLKMACESHIQGHRSVEQTLRELLARVAI